MMFITSVHMNKGQRLEFSTKEHCANCRIKSQKTISLRSKVKHTVQLDSIVFISSHTFPVRVILAQVGFSGSVLPQVPRGYSLTVNEALSSFNAFLAVGSRVVK